MAKGIKVTQNFSFKKDIKKGQIAFLKGIKNALDEGAKTYRANVPVDTGNLKNSGAVVQTKEGYALTIRGDAADYAFRQDREHKTKRGFIEKAIKATMDAYPKDAKSELKKAGL